MVVHVQLSLEPPASSTFPGRATPSGQHSTLSDDVVRKNESVMKARLEDTLKGAQLNEVRFLGVVGRDDNACHFGMVQKRVAKDGQPKTQVDVSAVAFIAGKVLYTNLYALYEWDYTMGQLLERQKATIARNIATNGRAHAFTACSPTLASTFG